MLLRGISLISKGQAGVAEILGLSWLKLSDPLSEHRKIEMTPIRPHPSPPGVASFLHHLLMSLIHDNTIVITEWYFVILYCHNSMACYKRNVDDCA